MLATHAGRTKEWKDEAFRMATSLNKLAQYTTYFTLILTLQTVRLNGKKRKKKNIWAEFALTEAWNICLQVKFFLTYFTSFAFFKNMFRNKMSCKRIAYCVFNSLQLKFSHKFRKENSLRTDGLLLCYTSLNWFFEK